MRELVFSSVGSGRSSDIRASRVPLSLDPPR